LSGDGDAENQEDPGYRTYMQPSSVPPGDVDPPRQPAVDPSPQPPAEPALPHDDDLEEAAVYKTYLQPLRVPPAPVESPPPPPEPEPVAAPSPQPPPQEAESPPPRAPEKPPPPVAPAASRTDFKDFKFRSRGQAGRPRRVLARVGATIVVAVGLALAYPLVNPFGSSSGSSLTQYLQRFQPIAARADQDRRSVQSAVNAVRRNPKSRKAAARRLAGANRDREALIRRLAALGPAPGAARALPGRLTRLLQSQVETGRVWQRWMVHHPFVYLKHDAATRNRIQSLLRSQQASKGSFTRLYAQLTRGVNLPLTKITGT
jgi:hypothetical protein